MNRFFLPFSLGFSLLLTSCGSDSKPQRLEASARYFLDHGGLTLLSRTGQAGTRPCLRQLNLKSTLLSGPLRGPVELVDFVEKHRLATVRREQRASGFEGVTVTPRAPYQENWVGRGDYQSFCFGTVELVVAEAVKDARVITAGQAEPYLVAGTEARATRLTYRLADVPTGSFVSDLLARPQLLVRGSMAPETYGQELTVVVTLPLNPDNFKVTS